MNFANLKIKLTNEMRYNFYAKWAFQQLKQPCSRPSYIMYGLSAILLILLLLDLPIAQEIFCTYYLTSNYTKRAKRWNVWINHLENFISTSIFIFLFTFHAASINQCGRNEAVKRYSVDLTQVRGKIKVISFWDQMLGGKECLRRWENIIGEWEEIIDEQN